MIGLLTRPMSTLGVGGTSAEVRAESVGRDDGRVYRIGFTARDVFGDRRSGVVRVAVPRRPGCSAVDDGALFDATVAP